MEAQAEGGGRGGKGRGGEEGREAKKAEGRGSRGGKIMRAGGTRQREGLEGGWYAPVTQGGW